MKYFFFLLLHQEIIHLPSFSIIQYKNREIRLAKLAYFSEAVEGKTNIQYISFVSQRLGVNIYQPVHTHSF